MLTLREQLIARLLNLQPERLHDVEVFLNLLETGGEISLDQLKKQPNRPGKLILPQNALADETKEGKKQSDDASSHSKDWPHAPVHRLTEHGTYCVTAGTLYKEHFFRAPDRLEYLEGRLLTLTKEYGWHVEAWTVFSNHYHFIAHATDGCRPLKEMLKHLHGETSTEVNRRDGVSKRQVWFNYWDSLLTFEKSYLARLNYVHQNAVRHGLVNVANQYPWSSAAWFERTSTPAQVQTIYGFKTDKIKIVDDFDV